MNIVTAQALVIRDRYDWNKPHLTWLPERLYRAFSEIRRR